MEQVCVLICAIILMFASNLSVAEVEDVKLHWDSTGNGYHRDLHLKVEGPEVRNVSNVCQLNVVLALPRGMYIDMYRIANNVEFGGPKVLTPDEIDIEKAAHHSRVHTVYLFDLLQVPRNVFGSPLSTALMAHVSFPVHLRYHKPSSLKDFTNIKLLKPELLVQCSDYYRDAKIKFAPCSHITREICDWQIPPQKCNQDILTFKVPVGQKSHTVFTTVLTLFVSLSSCGYYICVLSRKSLIAQEDAKPRK